MFADVSGSSSLYKQEGNSRAKGVIDVAINLMRELTQKNGGVVVKTIGDEIMSRFASAENACATAAAIQEQCHKATARDGIQGLGIRIGINVGPILMDGDDVFGDTVNDAACVAHIARANQILITQAMVEALPKSLQQKSQAFDRIHIKGEQTKSVIYRLIWEHTDDPQHATTVMATNHITQRFNTVPLSLEYNSRQIAITKDDLPYTIGRDHRRCHLHVDSALASRDHCHIVLRRGKFVLVDHSTNGTYVTVPDQPEIYLRREEIPLLGEGTICIGLRAGQDDNLTIRFKL